MEQNFSLQMTLVNLPFLIGLVSWKEHAFQLIQADWPASKSNNLGKKLKALCVNKFK